MLRKETIERLFGSAKEQHGFRYTQYIGNARMRMKAGLTFACMNLKKLAKILDVRERQDKKSGFFFILYKKIWELAFWQKKSGAEVRIQHQLCLQSEMARFSHLAICNIIIAYSSNSGVEKYLSAVSGSTVTTVLPGPSFLASCIAAATLVPLDIPHSIPSFDARSLAV